MTHDDSTTRSEGERSTIRAPGSGPTPQDEQWVEDDGLVSLRGYGYWAFHEDREYTEENWTHEQLVVLESAAKQLERFMNENWPRG